MSTSNESIIDTRANSMRGIIAFAVALLLPSLCLRFVQLFETGSILTVGDVRGFSADILVICGVLGLLVGLNFIPSRPVRIISLLFIPVFWCALTYGNYEHIKTLGAMSTWAYIAFLLDPTFVSGSLLQASRPYLLIVLLILTIGFCLLALRHRIRFRSAIKIIVVMFIPAMTVFTLISETLVADWRSNNHFIHNIAWAKTDTEVTANAHQISGLYPGDLSGEPRVALNNGNKNVLLLVLEGVSGAYLNRVANEHEISEPGANLPALDKIGDSGLVYLNFINHQRQTNRGLYALICGDLPRQRTSMPKMSEFGAHAIPRNCLPRLLKNNNYRTTYIQSAPLAFMGKDKFMPVAGFDETFGTEWLAANGAQTGKWGVNDNILLNKVADFIDAELEADQKPWFLTVLSAGTHHPFMVPDSYQSSETPGSFAHAVSYLNLAFDHFFNRLEEAGVLEDTLLLVTSDESFGQDKVGDLNDLLRTQAFGTLTIRAPEENQQIVREPFMQMDIPISILDYLGLKDDAGQLGGRSVFRKYAQSRPLPFANTYLRSSAMFEEDGSFTACDENLNKCRSYQLEDDMPLSANMSRIDVKKESIEKLAQIAERSYFTGIEETSTSWQLIETGKTFSLQSFDLEPDKVRIRVFGSQYLGVSANTTIQVSIEFFAEGEEMDLKVRQRLNAVPTSELPHGLEYSYLMSSARELEEAGITGDSSLGMRPQYEREEFFKQRWSASSPKSFTIEYEYTTGESLELMNCSLDFKNLSSNDVKLTFSKATMIIKPASENSEEGLKRLKVTDS